MLSVTLALMRTARPPHNQVWWFAFNHHSTYLFKRSNVMKTWHTLSKEEAANELQTNLARGLAGEIASTRFEEFGPNELVEKGLKSPWKILWEQLTGIMVVILIVSALISLLFEEYTDAIVIMIIVVLNAILGFTQEYRAERAMAALKKMAVPHVRVRRDGRIVDLTARELVPGDLVLLEAGNMIPADGRLAEAVNLRVQESVLTGESEPVEKTDKKIHEENLPLGDRRNLTYMGTVVTYGRGSMLVTETGMQTQLGHIANMIQSVEQEPTPLQRRLEQLGKGLAIAALGIVAIVFFLGVLRGEEVRLMFLTSISMAVAAVPEGLPAVVTIALALGAQRMLKRNALIRKLPAVETLGSVTIICSDKTGTLTENKMTVTILDVAGNQINLQEQVRNYSPSLQTSTVADPTLTEHKGVSLLLIGGSLSNDAVLEVDPNDENGMTSVGDPTEGALVIAAAKAGYWKPKLDQTLPRVAELPFDSERKRMSTLHRLTPGQEILDPKGLNIEEHILFTKGAVDGLLDISDRVWVNDHEEPLNEVWMERIQAANNQLAQKGMRVLGVGYRKWDGEELEKAEKTETGLVFVGMMGMIDPARAEVKAAVAKTREAGIRPVMITGDHPLTALHIAHELGITNQEKVITGQQLAEMSLPDLKTHIHQVSVFARVSPEHKLKIVQAFQETGQVVAMTGDGVNDAPALRKADIGVAMGITGTDVSKEAADMVLLDDNFATIVAAVEEGRRIYDNIRKFIRYTMTSNSGEIWVMLLAPFFGMPLPLLPLQILWVNLVTDGVPGLALTVEPMEKDTMKRPPYSPQESVFARGMTRHILFIGLLMGAVSLGVGLWWWNRGLETWQTMVFTTLTISQMGHALGIRSERYSLARIGLFSNKLLLGSVLLTLGLQIAVVYLPFFQEIFSTKPLSLYEFLVCLAFSGVVLLSVEIEKWWVGRKRS
jgi:Ca2+-transporting ATPase